MFYYFIFAIFAVGFVNGEKQHIHMRKDVALLVLPMAKNCITETGVFSDVLDKFTTVEPDDGGKFDKFLFCFFKSIGCVDDNGQAKVDLAIQTFPVPGVTPKELKDILEECNKEAAEGGSPAEVAGKLYFCFVKKSPVVPWF